LTAPAPPLRPPSPLLAGLQAKFMPRMAAAVRDCLAACAEGMARQDASALSRTLHALAGEASALGLTELASAAAAAEQRALAWRAEDSPATREACAQAVSLLATVAERLGDPPASTDRPRPAAPPARTRVLVIDDSAISAEAICEALEDAGLEARPAIDLPAALAAMSEFRPVVVLTDVQMPGLDPRAVCRALRSAGGAAPLRVVLMSGASDDELAAAMAHAGADAGVSKLEGTDAILRALDDVLS
jgi:chemotaxis family two-component system response regulator PixH